MATQPTDLRDKSLLAVFAHPDDESISCGGLLAWCADLGAEVSLLCATHGELGPGSDLFAARARELHAAARALGVTNVHLLDYEDGMLPWVDAPTLEADIRGAIRYLQPDVVVTFGEDGLYWHPDHIAIHERTTAAVASLSTTNIATPALYYASMPPNAARALVDCAAATRERSGEPALTLRVLGIADVDAFGLLAAPPTLILDTSAYAARKLEAIRCHRTQLADDALNFITNDDAARLIGIEYYRRAPIGSPRPSFIDHLALPT